MSDNKCTIKPDDLFRIDFLQDARASPDGRSVVYVVSNVDPVKNEEYAAIWLQSLDSGERRRLTSGVAYDSNPEWSHDGRRVAFISSRGEKKQIYVIAVDGGEARELTSLPQGVSGGPKWSPDDEYIAFTAPPETPERDPDEPYRIKRHIYRFDASGYLSGALQDIYIVPVDGGEPRRLTEDDCNNSAPVWSPDGGEIMFLSQWSPESHRIPAALKIVSMEGEVKEVVGHWGSALSGTWLPDGQRIAFIGSPLDSPAGTHSNLWIIGRDGGDPECRTSDLIYNVGGGLQGDMAVMAKSQRIMLSEDGLNAYVQAQSGGTVHIYRVATEGQESFTPVTTGERSCTLLDLTGDELFYSVSTVNNPTDLYCLNLKSGEERRLTSINSSLLEQFDLPEVERITFPSSDGVEVEGWFMRPPFGEAPYPTILYIHGGPHSGFGHVYSFDFQMLAGAGYGVLFINQRGSTGYGNEFASKIIGDWGNLDYKDLMAGVDHVVKRGLADGDRLGCCGLSGGGNLTAWIVGHTDIFKAAVPENPVINWVSFYGVSDIGPWFSVRELGGLPHEIPEVYRRCSPITEAHNCTTPTLLIQGEEDYRCPAEQSEQFYAVLKASGCVVEMLRIPKSSHTGAIRGGIKARRAQNEALLEWMNKYLQC